MQIVNQKHEQVAVTRLQPHPRNPNVGNLDAISTSIKENGFYGAVVAQKSTGYILVGHHRYQAALHAGAEKIPVFWVDVDDTRALKILLADNRTAELAIRDEEALATLLQELADSEEGLLGSGYDSTDLDTLLAKVSDDLPDSFKALDESIAQTVKRVTCPHCGGDVSV